MGRGGGPWCAAGGSAGVAHHALVALYDTDKPIEMTGTLKKMEFINPHSMLHLEVTNADVFKTVWLFQEDKNY